ncbi:stage III sporulation protein AF [Evansella vedderi]|uniref:Stage III sporulation protein AF n=1 Tax=Evansella vedderi TaxID=38282 RepID=A0ABT9ZYE5_9BACI|nr:stage III sporulation protein AF [Evansella vedderi]MDQ0256258.1 stage III sporulation protein AF [Evansella vedderi]
MSMITAWITNIILLILFATILELLLPNSKMQRYVKLVVGLMLLMVMLQPLLSIFQTDSEEWLSEITSWTNNEDLENTSSIDSKKMDIELDNLAYISEQVAVQLKNKASDELQERFEVVPLDVYLEYESFPEEDDYLDNLSDVYVLLQPMEDIGKVSDVKVVQIDPVEIMKEKQGEEEQGVNGSGEIITFLAALWEIPESKIHVQMKGGEE